MSPPVIEVRLLEHPVTYEPWSPFPLSGGAECVFIGRTRLEEHPEHGPLEMLSYAAYPSMAKRIMRELAERAAREHACLAVRLHHAIGDVPTGAASILIQTIAGHRAPAFAACRFLIEEVKHRVPIWKRERWARGSTWSPGAVVATAELARGGVE
jgi:molybdopterin synthase catalytic subunit